MGIIFTILGILVALIALPWLKRPIENLYYRFRERLLVGRALQDTLPAVNAVKRGLRSRVSNDFMICEWVHQVQVDSQGSTKTSVDCLVVNVSDSDKETITFPVYFDDSEGTLTVWAQMGRTPLAADLKQWEPDTGAGLVTVCFVTPLEPREYVRLKWGYGHRNSFSEGEEWWEWFIGRPHGMFRVRLSFDEPWTVSALRGSIVPDDHLPTSPKLHRSQIVWTVAAPIPGRKYRIEFRLCKKAPE